ncbi:SWIM zinc finger [Paenibacillaceae bacterium GAS479]|nr:SWIM zinc finger [Paenibacillaceae bacterium GAS479]
MTTANFDLWKHFELSPFCLFFWYNGKNAEKEKRVTAMGADEISESFLNELERKIADYTRKEIISRGWDYHSRGKVSPVKQAGSLLLGVVSGSELYNVTLGSRFEDNECTCPFNGWCKHMAAVYFAAIKQQGGQPERAMERMTGAGPVKVSWVEKAQPEQAASLSAAAAAGLSEDASPREWMDWMERKYGQTWQGCRHTLHPLQPVLSALKGSARDWPKSLQRMHWMYSILFILEQAERAVRLSDAFSRYYQEMSFTRMAEPWIEHYYSLAAQLTTETEEGLGLAWRDALAAYLREQAGRADARLFRWNQLYFGLAAALLHNAEWREGERLKLEKLLEAAGPPSSASADSTDASALASSQEEAGTSDAGRHFPLIALAYLDAAQGEDNRAVERLKQTSPEPASGLALEYAKQRLESREWEKFQLWMDYLNAIADGKRGGLLQPFLLLCREADLAQHENPTWQRYMIDKMPYSYMAVADLLLEKGSFEEWADLQLAMGLRPDELDPADMRLIAKRAPSVLIPLYHQAVEGWISMRNRQSYRMAVKQLKKLEKLYVAVKRPEAWKVYLERTVAKYQRMRAFQEELRKGTILK